MTVYRRLYATSQRNPNGRFFTSLGLRNVKQSFRSSFLEMKIFNLLINIFKTFLHSIGFRGGRWRFNMHVQVHLLTLFARPYTRRISVHQVIHFVAVSSRSSLTEADYSQTNKQTNKQKISLSIWDMSTLQHQCGCANICLYQGIVPPYNTAGGGSPCTDIYILLYVYFSRLAVSSPYRSPAL